MSLLRTLVCWSFLACVAGPAAAADVTGMPASEVEALQRRLADDKCYAGPVDGRASEALTAAVAACPSQDPQLRIETGMHVAVVSSIDADRACQIAVTGSVDKTARLWSLPEGRLLATLRVPVGAGNGGKVAGTAISPDGRFVAVGGWDAQFESTSLHSVSVFDAGTGALIARAGRFAGTINHLAFSPDGHWLAASLGGGHGVGIVDAATWQVVATDDDYGAPSYGAAFGPDDRLYTVALDGKLRRYGAAPTFRKEASVATRGGKLPYSVAVDPTGKLVGVGFYDAAKVDLYDAASLALRPGARSNEGSDGNLSNVAWRADGARIVAGGHVSSGGKRLLLGFGRDGRKAGDATAVADDTITGIAPCASGFAVAAADPGFGTLDPSGKVRTWKRGVAPDLRNKIGDAFTLSGDAKRVRFGLADGSSRPVMFDVATSLLSDAPALAGLSAARTESLPVADWRDRGDPSFAGQPIELAARENSRAIAIRPDRTGFVLGADFTLRSFDAQGSERWKRQIPNTTSGVNLSADGRIVVAAYGDGTVRWHRWSDGQELLALFVNRDTKAWVAWTPAGYYMASPGGEDMIGWQVNRGWDQAADFFPASRFRDKFSRPDIVGLVLDTLDETQAVRQANATAKRRDDTIPIIERLPPVLTILSPASSAQVAPGAVEIRYGVRSPSGAAVDRVEAFVDGAKVEARGLARPDAGTGTITLRMPAHDAVVSLVAYAGPLASDAARVELKGAGTGSGDAARKPTLYALLVGVSHYEDADLNLGYAAKDASDLADTLKAQGGQLYGDVQIKLLTDKDATSTAVKDGLLWLQGKASADDLELLFVAGHGLTDAKGKFWFLTYDADPARVLSTSVSRDDITGVLYDLPGKKLMFLDACHSGAALEQAGARGLEKSTADLNTALSDFSQAEGGVVAYAASTGREFSYERADWGHGAFTKALIEGLGGKADLLHKGTITTSSLDTFLADRVKELTGGQQHPVMNRPKTVPDFPIARAARAD